MMAYPVHRLHSCAHSAIDTHLSLVSEDNAVASPSPQQPTNHQVNQSGHQSGSLQFSRVSPDPKAIFFRIKTYHQGITTATTHQRQGYRDPHHHRPVASDVETLS